TVNYEPVKDPDHPDEVVPDPHQETESLLAVFLPSWLSKAGVIISSRWSGQGWIPSIQIRPVNVRPINALVFEFAASGNAAGLQSLMRRGEASVSDVDEEGWTPLHYAANTRQLATCKLLAQSPGSKAMLNTYNTTPLDILWLLPVGSDCSGLREMVRILVDVAGCDPFQENLEGKSFFGRCINIRLSEDNLMTIRWLLRHPNFQHDPDQLNSKGHTLLMEFVLLGPGHEEDIDCLLQVGADVNARMSSDDWEFPSWTALHCAVYAARKRLTAYTALIKHLVQRGADVHAVSRKGVSVTDLIWTLHKDDTKNFLLWRDLLLDLGHNLLEFVEKEVEAHTSFKWFQGNLCAEALLLNFGFVPDLKELVVDVTNTSHDYRDEDDDVTMYDEEDIDDWFGNFDHSEARATLKRHTTPLEKAIYYGLKNFESSGSRPTADGLPRCYFQVQNDTASTVDTLTLGAGDSTAPYK
ncbi:MAG: hypothetical protein M4579_007313, partial [Chaenotheca gracillima]